MSQQEFESYLRLLARFLHLNGGQREAIARELRAHMEDRLEDILARGYTREEAIQTALDEFGDAAALAGEFGRIGRRRRWIMRTTTATIGIAAAVLLVSFLLPEHRGWLPAPAFTHADEGTMAAPVSTEKPAQAPPTGVTARSQDYVSETETAADRQTLELLRGSIPVVDLPEGTSFADAIEFLRVQAKIPLTVNWAALSQMGVERTTDTGGLSLRDVKVATALGILLDNTSQAGGNAGKVAYDVADGVVRISNRDDLSTRTIVRIYDCRDLMGQTLTPAQKRALDGLAGRPHRQTMAVSSTPTTQPATAEPMVGGMGGAGDAMVGAVELVGGGGMGGMGGAHGGTPWQNLEAPSAVEILAELRARDSEAFVELITSTVEPESWEKLGVATEYDGLLVVRHNWAAQQQVADLLRAIRTAKAARGRTDH